MNAIWEGIENKKIELGLVEQQLIQALELVRQKKHDLCELQLMMLGELNEKNKTD